MTILAGFFDVAFGLVGVFGLGAVFVFGLDAAVTVLVLVVTVLRVVFVMVFRVTPFLGAVLGLEEALGFEALLLGGICRGTEDCRRDAVVALRCLKECLSAALLFVFRRATERKEEKNNGRITRPRSMASKAITDVCAT